MHNQPCIREVRHIPSWCANCKEAVMPDSIRPHVRVMWLG